MLIDVQSPSAQIGARVGSGWPAPLGPIGLGWPGKAPPPGQTPGRGGNFHLSLLLYRISMC